MTEALPYIYKEDNQVAPSVTKAKRKTITHVFIRKDVPSVIAQAFQDCNRLVEVIFAKQGSSSLKHVYSHAFEKCSGLEHISFPESLQTIGKCAFRQCINLSELEFPADGALTEIDTKAFEGCKSLCAISFPDSTTTTTTTTVCTVGYQAFANCTSLLGVEIPSNKNMKFGRNAFQGCHALVNVSIPMTMAKTGTERCFATCSSLQKCYPACDFPEALMDRYYKLPLHNLCYHASTSKLQDLHLLMDTYNKYDAVDRWGMTAYHILATLAKLRADWIMALLNSKYPLGVVVLKKDRNHKTMLDYLILHKSKAAIIVLKKVLQRLLEDGMEWGIELWRLDMWQLVELYGRGGDGRLTSSTPHHRHTDGGGGDDDEDEVGESNTCCWDQRIQLRQKSLDEITRRLAGYGRKEVTSLLEQALWKMNIKPLLFTAATCEMSRENSRWNCGSEFVIPHVMDYIWHDSEPPSDGLMYLNL